MPTLRPLVTRGMPRPWRVLPSLVAIVLLLAGAALWQLRQDALGSQGRELGVLSLALTDEIDRTLRGVELGLHALQLEAQAHRLPVSGPAAGSTLRTRAALMPMVDSLWLVDVRGQVLAASDATPPPDPGSFLPRAATLDSSDTAISRVFPAARGGQPTVALAVRFGAAQGPPQGWIVAAIPARALLGAFSIASPATDVRMAVFRRDGALLAGSIADVPQIDETRLAHRLASLRGTELRRFRDGTERLVAHHSVARLGIDVLLTRDLAVVLAAWQDAARFTVLALALVLAAIGLSLFLVVRADLRHAAAQQALLAQRARASKLESLGTLAGGVAHDFNNVLAAIVGYGEMAQDAAAPGSAQARQLEHVLRAALRGKALVERILIFSRGGARAARSFALEPVVAEVLALLAASLPPGVVLAPSLRAPRARLRGDATQAFEAVMNLCTNAIQAMPESGRLEVSVERIDIHGQQVLSHALLPQGAYLVVQVADTGPGIAPEVMEHLFEPFFTTRGAQSGTGLGLAVVHGVVAEFGGAIDVQSPPGQGARFALYLPECLEAAACAPTVPRHAPVGTGQSLLVVDDEAVLARLAVEMLSGMGYQPVAFTDPRAALHALTATPRRFAALLTDEVMPGLSGTQLIEAALAVAPRLPVLLVSGYGGAMLASRAAAAGAARVLSKPLQRAELAQALAEVLG